MEDPDPSESGPIELKPCGICGRTFRPDALTRHQNVCEKTAAKKRKIFDSSKQRALEEAAKLEAARPQPKKQPPAKAKTADEKPKPKASWREKHEELVETIRAARSQDTGKNSSGAEVKKKVPSGYVQCPGCERHFNERAAERHIPWCQKKKSETPKSPVVVDEAKEKLIARVRYRPPKGKSRVLHRKTKTADSVPLEGNKRNATEVKPQRDKTIRSSPPKLVDNHNSRNSSLDRVNNNVTHSNFSRRSGSRSREKETASSPELPSHIIKFKERFPNRKIKRNGDLEESLTTEQLRELLSCSRITDRCPRTVPGVRLSGGQQTNRNDNWNYRNSEISRSASSSGGSSNSWNKRLVDKPTLPEVSSSELPGTTWTGKLCWNGDLDNSMSSTGSSSGGSSSGGSSSGSLPPLSRESNDEVSLTFYCHQCHSKFPLIAAKYCCECGAKRRGLGAPIGIHQTG